MIACGAADAGLGVRAAAERLGLDFVTLGWETYYLAASRALDAPILDGLVAAIRARRAQRWLPHRNCSLRRFGRPFRQQDAGTGLRT